MHRQLMCQLLNRIDDKVTVLHRQNIRIFSSALGFSDFVTRVTLSDLNGEDNVELSKASSHNPWGSGIYRM